MHRNSSSPPPAAKPTAAGPNRRFGLAVGGALLLGAAAHYLRHGALLPWLLVPGGLLGALAALVPRWLTAPRRGWEALGRALGRANTYVLLTLAYVLVCIPLGALLRLRGKDPLGKKWLPGAPTYWQPKGARSSLRLQF